MTYSSGNSIHKLTVEKCSLSIDIYRAVSKQITIQYEVAVKFDGEWPEARNKNGVGLFHPALYSWNMDESAPRFFVSYGLRARVAAQIILYRRRQVWTFQSDNFI